MLFLNLYYLIIVLNRYILIKVKRQVGGHRTLGQISFISQFRLCEALSTTGTVLNHVSQIPIIQFIMMLKFVRLPYMTVDKAV